MIRAGLSAIAGFVVAPHLVHAACAVDRVDIRGDWGQLSTAASVAAGDERYKQARARLEAFTAGRE